VKIVVHKIIRTLFSHHLPSDLNALLENSELSEVRK